MGFRVTLGMGLNRTDGNWAYIRIVYKKMECRGLTTLVADIH